jgi:hypothetical protein
MKSLMLILLGLSAQANAGMLGCESVTNTARVQGWGDVDAVQLVSGPVFAGGKINCLYYPAEQQRMNVLTRIETGSIDGAGYSIQYADGSAVVQGESDKPLLNGFPDDRWSIRCSQSDERRYRCEISRLGLVIIQQPDGSRRVVLGGHYLPGTGLLLRVDSNWAIKAASAEGFSEAQTQQILQEMQSGQTIVTHFHDQARQQPTDSSYSLFGFAQALLIAEQVQQQLNRIPANQPAVN